MAIAWTDLPVPYPGTDRTMVSNNTAGKKEKSWHENTINLIQLFLVFFLKEGGEIAASSR